MIHVLLIEDDLRIARFIKAGLDAEGFAVIHSTKGGDGALEAKKLHKKVEAREAHSGVLIIDLNLPDVYGLDLCRSLRRTGVALPIMMLTAQTDVSQKISALNGGADDYLTKPFDFGELVARIRVLARRSGVNITTPADADTIQIGRLTVDMKQKEALIDGRFLHLSRREFDILQVLATSFGSVVSKERIYASVWGIFSTPDTNILNVHVSNIRQKLQKGPNLPQIKALRGRGFHMFMPSTPNGGHSTE